MSHLSTFLTLRTEGGELQVGTLTTLITTGCWVAAALDSLQNSLSINQHSLNPTKRVSHMACISISASDWPSSGCRRGAIRWWELTSNLNFMILAHDVSWSTTSCYKLFFFLSWTAMIKQLALPSHENQKVEHEISHYKPPGCLWAVNPSSLNEIRSLRQHWHSVRKRSLLVTMGGDRWSQ